jgi:hypothetical protein
LYHVLYKLIVFHIVRYLNPLLHPVIPHHFRE